MISAIGFDLGDTLIEYNNVPLSWSSLYKEALIGVLDRIKVNSNQKNIDIGKDILTKYNTRLNPREVEVDSQIIFEEILENWGISKDERIDVVIKTFFSYFQRKVIVFEDTIKVLESLKKLGIKIGILTDVPYGMTREFVENDICEFSDYVDCLLTSVEVGYRKPNIKGYNLLANKLRTPVENMMYIGNEKKDIIGANDTVITSVLIDRNKSRMKFGQDYTIETLSEILKIVEYKNSNIYKDYDTYYI